MSVDDASAALTELRYSLLVIGTNGPTGPHFMIANWGVQASFDPWRFILMLKKTSHTLSYARASGAFTVNLLDASKRNLVTRLLKEKGEGFDGIDATIDAPRLKDAYAGFECKILDAIDIGGDHTLVVSDVVEGWKTGEGPPVTLPELKLSYAG